VLLPVRNGGRFVDRAVRSTLRALPRDAELVVLDDASSDDTAVTLERIGDPRLRTIQNSTSAGVSAGLNQLLAATDSEFIARMDADDVTLPWRFRWQSAELSDHDFAFTSVVFIRANGTIIRPEQPGRITAAALPLHLLIGPMLVHPTMFARRAVVESLGGYRATPGEDFDLWLRALNAGHRIVRTGYPGLLYRRHANQVTAADARNAKLPDPLVDPEYATLFARELGSDLDSFPYRIAGASGDRSGLSTEQKLEFERRIAARAAELPRLQRARLTFRLSRL
jgi:glycosyltransferase involved in cell wall biosynthesis